MKDFRISSGASGSRLPAPANLHQLQMKDSKKWGGVSRFAATASLHQVRNGAEDSHSRVGVSKLSSSRSAAQLRNRLSWYVAYNSSTLSGEKIPRVPQIRWKCPPTFDPEPDCHVACGEESLEAKKQKWRETTFKEAVYPRPTEIPPNPFTTPYVESETYDDSQTPVISLIPIEELAEQVRADAESNLKKAEAAAATVAAAMEKGGAIDVELLIKIISDPEMVKKLINSTVVSSLEVGGRPNECDDAVKFHNSTINTARSISQPHQLGENEQIRPPMFPSVAIMSVPDAITTVIPAKPSTSKPDVGAIKKLIHEYGAGDTFRIRPQVAPTTVSTSYTAEARPQVAPMTISTSYMAEARPPVAPMMASTSRPSRMEEFKNRTSWPVDTMVGSTSRRPNMGVDHRWGNPYVGPRPSVLPPIPVLPHDLPNNYVPPGNFCFSRPSHAPVMDFNRGMHYNHHGLHGKKHETEEQEFPKFGQYGHYTHRLISAQNNPTPVATNLKPREPCMYFAGFRGCRNGFNCRFKHA